MSSEPAASRGRRWQGQSCYWWPETRVSSMQLGEFCPCRQTRGSRLSGMRAGCPARRRAQDSAALWGMVVRRGRKGCTGAGTVSAQSVSHLRQIPRRRTPGLTRPWQVPFPPSSSSVHGAPRRPTKAGRLLVPDHTPVSVPAENSVGALSTESWVRAGGQREHYRPRRAQLHSKRDTTLLWCALRCDGWRQGGRTQICEQVEAGTTAQDGAISQREPFPPELTGSCSCRVPRNAGHSQEEPPRCRPSCHGERAHADFGACHQEGQGSMDSGLRTLLAGLLRLTLW